MKQITKDGKINALDLDPMGGALKCCLDTSLCHLPDGNLNQLKNRSV